jgi:hypothetical protein
LRIATSKYFWVIKKAIGAQYLMAFPRDRYLPRLFLNYIYDLPNTKGLKFQYADDIAIAYQNIDLEDVGKTLTEDLITMNKYFSKWRLKSNPAKTEVYAFNLNNKKAREELKVTF